MDFLGQYVLLLFYRNIGSPEVTDEIVYLNSVVAQFLKLRCQIIVVCPVSVPILVKFVEYLASKAICLQFMMISDYKREIFQKYGLYDFSDMSIKNGTFIIDEYGVLQEF